MVGPDPLPYIAPDQAPIPARMRETPEDFRVEEVPAYEPSGEGDHVFFLFEKRDLTTDEAVRRIARAAGADPSRAGWAGLKDRRAVTVQWASFEGVAPDAVAAVAVEGVRVLRAARHPHKLRTGHLHGNRFELVLRGFPADRFDDARAVLARLTEVGLPNYFGEQRFGRAGDNAERARRWLVDGGRPPRKRFERKLLVSALQSELFNRVCAERVAEGLLATAVPGDLLRKEDTGGMFVAEDMEDARARCARFETSATGPMFGPRMRWPEADAREREERVLAALGVGTEHLARFGKIGQGTRRPLRVRPRDLALDSHPDGAVVRFVLPAGTYATTLTRELLKQDATALAAR